KFIKHTFTIKYMLPISSQNKTSITLKNDYCLHAFDENNVAESIYSGIVDYCLNEIEIDITKLEQYQIFAIKNRLRYDEDDELDTKLKYGFFGEIIFSLILSVMFTAQKIIAKGHFYNPLEKSETKGYDSFHFIQQSTGKLEFWFGEAKMYTSLQGAITKVLENINKALSKNYYETNIRAIVAKENDLDNTGISDLLKELNRRIKEDDIKISDFIKLNHISLVYPILLVYNKRKSDFELEIKRTI